MNRWTGTGHLTKDPKLLQTGIGTAVCTLRIAVKRAGRQGQDGYFDVKCFDAQAHACVDYLKAGREIAIDGRLLLDEFQTQDGDYASRVYIIAERVEFLATRNRSTGQASDEASLQEPAAPAGERATPAARPASLIACIFDHGMWPPSGCEPGRTVEITDVTPPPTAMTT